MTASQEDRTAPKVNSERVARDIQAISLRYRAGLISLAQAKQELAFQQALLKALEQADIEERLEKLEAIAEGRRP